MSRIASAFKKRSAQNKKAFIVYIMAGDPDLQETKKRVLMLAKSGVDIIELGVPFSDPLADGPTIQMAAERALNAGVALKDVISLVRELRAETSIPLVLMTYQNPVFKYGEERFVADAAAAGVDGVIIPDLPFDEAAGIIKPARAAKLDTIFLAAPTSTNERAAKIAAASRGFVYYVSLVGITGSKLEIGEDLRDHISYLKSCTATPVAAGFGVSNPQDAKLMSEIADGVIVGSAIVKVFHEQPDRAEDFIKQLREAI
ncbi:MAG: tryptophan synthase subunit alpha [Dissulfurispiraceae bacterium]|nr:tryptophan synthase subunit alpha [Dissulfurispiraceae bacterium]